MTKLYYKSLSLPKPYDSPMLLLAEIESDISDALLISINKTDYSTVIVNGKSYTLRQGEAKLPLCSIPHGICEVAFVSGTKKHIASPFLNENGRIARVPNDSDALWRLESVINTLAERLNAQEEKIVALEEKITPKNMFNFN